MPGLCASMLVAVEPRDNSPPHGAAFGAGRLGNFYGRCLGRSEHATGSEILLSETSYFCGFKKQSMGCHATQARFCNVSRPRRAGGSGLRIELKLNGGHLTACPPFS